jgi:endonuclease/exonuclease/phosphatase family metal-dependent hydrolase
MPALRIVAFNAHDNYARTWLHVDAQLPDSHVLVIPEAYREGDIQSQSALHKARPEGTERIIADVVYNDADPRKDRHHLVLVGMPEVVERIEPIRLVGRTALRASLKGGIDIIGLHLDDRREEMRRRQTQALLDQLDLERLTIIAGDLNSMHRDDWRAGVLRRMGPLAERLPQGEPGEKQPIMARFGSLAARLTRMAEGGPLAMLEQAGYKDTDPGRRATMGFVQIDHIMVPSCLAVAAFTVRPMRGLSDHCAVAAEVVIP